MENTANTCTDSLVTAIDDEAFLLGDFLPHDDVVGSSVRCASVAGNSANYQRCNGGVSGGSCGCSSGGGCGGGGGRVHFSGGGGDDLSLYGTPKEELGPIAAMGNHNGPSGGGRGSVASGANVAAGGGASGESGKQSFIKNQLQALFQPTDNKLAMKLFGSKKALMKERIRQKETGHWVIHPCSSFR